LDYYTSAGVTGCPGLLVEPAATNLTLHSEDFATTWSQQNITVTTGTTAAFTSPAGFTNADLITTTADDMCFCSQEITVASGTSSISVFAKYNNHPFFRIANGDSEDKSAWFDIQNGEVLSVNGGTASIQNYGNGWYRCIYNPTTTDSGPNAFVISVVNDGGETFSSPGQSMYFWGAQFETGGVATSYIPTTTATVTRNADNIFVSGAVSGSIGQTEGTIYWDIAAVFGVTTGTGNPQFGVRNNAFTNWISLTTNNLANPFRITSEASGDVVLLNYSSPITSGKAAVGYSSAGLVLFVNGSLVASSATNPNFTFQRIEINGLSVYKTNAFALYTTRLTNAQLAALTTL
jgi:hypothetical protein